jgi:hypothetical protein
MDDTSPVVASLAGRNLHLPAHLSSEMEPSSGVRGAEWADTLDGAPAISTSNPIIDPAGTIQFFKLLDMNHFDAKLVHPRAALDKLIAKKKQG